MDSPWLTLVFIKLPEFRPLIFGIPLVGLITEREYPFLGPGFFFIPPSSTEGRVKSVLVQGLL
jgi:hypothetical protein